MTHTSSGTPGASWIRRRSARGAAAFLAAAALVATGALGSAANAAPASQPAKSKAALQSGSNQYSVQVTSGSLVDVAKAVRKLGGHVDRKLKSLGVLLVTASPSVADRIAGLPGVGAVTGDTSLEFSGATYDPLTDGGSLYNIVDQMGVDDVWASGARGGGTGVAVIDTGISRIGPLQHSPIVDGVDLSFDSVEPALRYGDLFGHGTVMAGIIGSRPNDTSPGAYRGIAPDAQLVNVKVGDGLGRADVTQVLAAIDWVVAKRQQYNIRVINLSFGTNSTQSYLFDPLAHAAEVAWRNGVVVVAAAGNDGDSLAMPAADPYVIAVGALDTRGTPSRWDDRVASFSNRGSWDRGVDLLAPGVGVQSLRVPGSYVDAAVGPDGGLGSGYVRGSGTSEAAAVVSGAVALLLGRKPWLTPDQVKDILKRSGYSVYRTNRTVDGVGVDLGAAMNLAPTSTAQSWQRSTGTGSLDASRGTDFVYDNDGNALTGQRDISGKAYDAALMASLREALDIWDWGRGWAATSWAGASWRGASWTGASWTGASWTGASWRGASWRGASWTGASWTGASWKGASWRGASWTGASWKGATFE